MAFHRLIRPMALDRPFDAGFRDVMLKAAKHVMQCGFVPAH